MGHLIANSQRIEHTAFALSPRCRVARLTLLGGSCRGQTPRTMLGWKGRSHNALAETINGFVQGRCHSLAVLKNREAVELATLNWVDWFNHRRPLEPIRNIPPAEAEANG